jgi:hypothetical protein
MRNKKFLFILFVLVFGLFQCTPRDRYERLVEKELETGERYDSLFLGLKLGMTNHQFYGHCWEMNKQGVIRQGSGNSSVRYEVKNLKSPAEMNFYPDFYHGRIWRMPVKINYMGWAPWNRKLSADSLQIDLLEHYREIYGNNFMEVRHPIKGSAFIRVDGNRRIAISKADDQSVWVIYTDLLVENELKAENEKEGTENDTEENPLLDAIGGSGD